MLNKLLKRCMPWQQKGKWVRIYIDWTDTNNPPVVKGPDWLNITVVDAGHGEYNLRYNPNDYYSVTEIKPTITSTITSEGDDFQKLIYIDQGIGWLSSMYGAKGYVDMFLCELDITRF